MVRKLIDWAVANPLVVMILVTTLGLAGGYAVTHVNIEAYPDPAPAIIEVVAQYPGASAEEVERQVTIPLEVALAGMPGLETTRSKSLFGLSHVRNQFGYSRDYEQAKQDVLNRLANVNLPAGVNPQISPASPIGEIIRFTVYNPRNAAGEPVYSLSDLKMIQDYVIQRELLRVPRIAGVTGFGGTVNRFEVQPDPVLLNRYGVTLAQLQTALGNSNVNGSGDNLTQGRQRNVVVRSLGLIGQGQDPYLPTLACRDPAKAAAHLRVEEARRCREIRQIVVISTNNVPVRVDNLVDGGPVLNADGSVNLRKLFQKPDGSSEWDGSERWDDGSVLNTDGTTRDDDATIAVKLTWSKTLVSRGVVVSYQTRQGRVGLTRPLRSRPWSRLSDREKREVREQNGWPAPPETDLWEDIHGVFKERSPEPGNPESRVWWRDERLTWQSRPADARTWDSLTAEEHAAVRQQLAGRLPAAEPVNWRFYHSASDRWDGWDDGRWIDEDDVVQGVVLMRKGQESLPALRDVMAKIDELNQPGKLPVGMKLVPYYNRTDLVNRTTETVNENLLVGMALVTAILLMFLGNVRAAIIVAINIPLALLFAFGVLYARGRSANLLSIGAVDFGIIVDSTVIIVESIYRHLNSRDHHGRPLQQRISVACGAVTKSLFFATIIMVCALLPLFTMKGPEGQIFGPMADTYAFALAGALFFALTVSPVLCLLFLSKLGEPPSDSPWARFCRGASKVLLLPILLAPFTYLFVPRPGEPENRLVRALNWLFLLQLSVALRLRWVALAAFAAAVCYTGVVAANMGREFMPELEEGALLIRGTLPVNVSLEEATERSRQFRALLREFPELVIVVPAIGRPDDGTDPTGYYNMESNIPLRPQPEWPAVPKYGRPRTKQELVRDLNEALKSRFPGVDWDISQVIRDNVMEALSGVKGENSIKVFGPELDTLERTAGQIKDELGNVPGVENPGLFRIQGQSNLEFPIDRRKCALWAVSAADVQATIGAIGGKAATVIQEGDKQADLTVRFPLRLRGDESAIRAIPVPANNMTTPGGPPATPGSPYGGSGIGTATSGSTLPLPSATGNPFNPAPVWTNTPTRRLEDLVTPLNANGQPDPNGSFLRPGASTIYREQGQRFIAIKFEARGRDLASTVADARSVVDPMLKPPYRAEWSGEFKQMEEAEKRIARMFALALILIALLLYLAFRSWLDAAVVFANVLAMGIGGLWALKVAGLNFNISAAVGFISILGVAVMNGLLFVSTFNSLRAHGVSLDDALRHGTRQLVRPVVMTALAAILGLLPAAFSTKMGSESQRPLAVVVVGGMLFTIFALVLVPLLYSFYGERTPPAGAGDLAH